MRLSEEEAKAKGLNYKTGKFSFMANSRARAVNDTEGMVRDTCCPIYVETIHVALSNP